MYEKPTTDRLSGTSQDFWDCECDESYIHPAQMPFCPECGTWHENMPDSRLDELADANRLYLLPGDIVIIHGNVYAVSRSRDDTVVVYEGLVAPNFQPYTRFYSKSEVQAVYTNGRFVGLPCAPEE